VTAEYTISELESYLDEALTSEEMGDIEQALRTQPELLQKLAQINRRRDAGVHSVGEIWRRHRMSCPTREQFGSFLLGVLDDATHAYVEFHLKVVACRFCNANLHDMEQRQAETNDTKATRHKKYFDSSAGYLKKKQ
jgi:hypothetical protein